MVERRGVDPPGSRGSDTGSSNASSLNNTFTGRSTLPSSTSLEGLGSASSLEASMARSLGSRGSLTDDGEEADNINVVVRCRPLSEKEQRRGDDNNLIFPGEGQIWVNMDGMNGQQAQKPKVFTYNVVFEAEATQEDVFEHSGLKRLLDMAVEGFSCTVFCYGQTGSGKTHTLTGPPRLFEKGPNMFSEDHGLIFRSFVYLFSLLQSRDDHDFTLTASYLEIYNEKVIDLLNMGTSQKPLQVRWSKKKRGFFVENLFEIECAELDDLLAVLEEGLRNRAVASHNMNEYSSRSHTILSINITSEKKADDGVYITRNGKINFVDLAGSEMTKKTNSEGKTLEEANNINKSLMVLGTCIAALSDSRKKDGHIPYRDSKLTKLLADSLSGSGVTLMIACVSPAWSNVSESINTLRYASRAKRIRTKPLIIMDPKEKVILSLQREVSLLREENAHLKMLLDLADVKGGTNEAPSMPPRQGSFRVDKTKLTSLNNQELINLVQHQMTEHEAVRMENKELRAANEAFVREHDLVCKENEKLMRKLDDYSRTSTGDNARVPSPYVPEHPVRSAEEVLNASRVGSFMPHALPKTASSQVWVNPLNDSAGRYSGSPGTSRSTPGSRGRGSQLPDAINKELEKRRIGKSLNDLSGGAGGSGGGRRNRVRRNSWDEQSALPAFRGPGKSRNGPPETKSGPEGGRSRSVPRGRGGGSPGRRLHRRTTAAPRSS